MRRIWVSAAAMAASVSVAGWMAVSFAEEKKPGAALPPPSLFDDAPNQVRAVDAPAGVPATAVVQAKPMSSASVKAEAGLPPPENFEDEQQARKVVWWKPWTWFSGRSRPAAETAAKPGAPAAAVTAPTPATSPAASSATSSAAAADARQGYAFDAPERRIRSGVGGCVKTGMWEPNGVTDACGNPIAKASASPADALTQSAAAPAAVSPAAPVAAAAPAPAASASAPGASSAPAGAASTPVPAAPERVEVSALNADPDDQRRPLTEKDAFDSVRVNTGAARDADTLSPATIAATRARGDTAGAGAANSDAADAGQASAAAATTATQHKGGKRDDTAHDSGRRDAGKSAGSAKRVVEDKPLSMSAEALFGFKSAKLLYGGKKQLDEFAAKLTDGDFQSVRVVGHTDRVGAPERNKRLSLRRAKAVKDYLVMKGIPASRIVVDGRGAEEPVTEPRQCEGLPMTARRSCMSPDRRVEIVVTRAFAKRKPESVPAAAEPRS